MLLRTNCKQLITDAENVEHLFIEVSGSNPKFVICGVYIPPSSALETYMAHCIAIGDIYSRFNGKIIVLGNYNLPNARWINDNMGVIVECAEGYPACEVADHRGVYLDLVFSNYQELEVSAVDLLMPNSVHHIAYNCILYINSKFQCINSNGYYYNFKSANYIYVNGYLGSIN